MYIHRTQEEMHYFMFNYAFVCRNMHVNEVALLYQNSLLDPLELNLRMADVSAGNRTLASGSGHLEEP